MFSRPLIRYVLTAASRDRLFLAMVLALLVAISVSLFMSSAAVIEQDQFALVFTAGSLRLVTVTALTLFVVFYMHRAFETKDVEFLLSRPIRRIQYVFSHALAFSILALIMSGLAGLSVFALSLANLSEGMHLWFVSITVEAVIMVNVALFFSLVITSAVGAAMACFGFYILCRMMGQFLGIIYSDLTPVNHILEAIMQTVSSVMPRLDLMGQTSWLLYGSGGEVGFLYIVLQGAVFVFLVLTAASIDLVRKQF